MKVLLPPVGFADSPGGACREKGFRGCHRCFDFFEVSLTRVARRCSALLEQYVVEDSGSGLTGSCAGTLDDQR